MVALLTVFPHSKSDVSFSTLGYTVHLQNLNTTAGLVMSSYTSSLTCFCGGHNVQAEPSVMVTGSVTCPTRCKPAQIPSTCPSSIYPAQCDTKQVARDRCPC